MRPFHRLDVHADLELQEDKEWQSFPGLRLKPGSIQAQPEMVRLKEPCIKWLRHSVLVLKIKKKKIFNAFAATRLYSSLNPLLSPWEGRPLSFSFKGMIEKFPKLPVTSFPRTLPKIILLPTHKPSRQLSHRPGSPVYCFHLAPAPHIMHHTHTALCVCSVMSDSATLWTVAC